MKTRYLLLCAFVVLAGCSEDDAEPATGVDAGDTAATDAGAGGDTRVTQDGAMDTSAEDAEVLDPGVVRVAGGLLRGEEVEGIYAFRGIPYAAPPVGELRWRAPEPAPAWDGELSADAWPPPCAQMDQATEGLVGEEDCLYLNVWSPVDAAGAPVIVFIHGGGNMFGSTSEQSSGVNTYEGEKLARRSGAIVVTLQYRLNILGYLSHAGLDGEVGAGASGNWGLRDQVAALEWVQENIGAFGGDRERTLLFGESGGASSVCGLVATPAAAGLFRAAIMQSGGCGGKALDGIRAWSDGVAAAVGCEGASDPVACLRAAPVEGLVIASSSGGQPDQGVAQNAAGPTIDGALLPRSPVEMFGRGEHNHVPLVFGVNAEETAWPFFGIVGAGQVWDEASYEARVRAIFGPLADEVLAEYTVGGAGGFRNYAEALIALTTDVQFICPNRSYARAAAASQEPPVFRYLFSHRMEGGGVGLSLLGAFHGLELMFNFQHLDDLDGYEVTAADLAVERTLLQFWLNMAADGAPGEVDGVAWPAYDLERDTYLDIAEPLGVGEGLRTARCDFWAGLGR